MILHTVTLRYDPAAKGGISFDLPPDHEKCRLRIVLGEQVQNPGGPFRVGTVVNR